MRSEEIEKEIYATFADIASAIGYSEVNGRIIAALLVARGPLHLQELSKKIGCSPATISISLDLLALIGMVKKMKRPGDRKLYVRLEGSLLEGLKKAFLLKIETGTADTLSKFKKYKNRIRKGKNGDRKRLMESLKILEKEVKKLDHYIRLLSKIRLS